MIYLTKIDVKRNDENSNAALHFLIKLLQTGTQINNVSQCYQLANKIVIFHNTTIHAILFITDKSRIYVSFTKYRNRFVILNSFATSQIFLYLFPIIIIA